MKNTKKINGSLNLIQFAVFIFLFSCGASVKAARQGAEGTEWMKWNNDTRQIYVRSYVQGMVNGFNRGCDEGVSAAKPNANGDVILKDMSKCLSHSPISTKDSMLMVSAITQFYIRYPEQRFVNIADILLDLHAGLSIEQIHKRFVGDQR